MLNYIQGLTAKMNIGVIRKTQTADLRQNARALFSCTD